MGGLVWSIFFAVSAKIQFYETKTTTKTKTYLRRFALSSAIASILTPIDTAMAPMNRERTTNLMKGELKAWVRTRKRWGGGVAWGGVG